MTEANTNMMIYQLVKSIEDLSSTILMINRIEANPRDFVDLMFKEEDDETKEIMVESLSPFTYINVPEVFHRMAKRLVIMADTMGLGDTGEIEVLRDFVVSTPSLPPPVFDSSIV